MRASSLIILFFFALSFAPLKSVNAKESVLDIQEVKSESGLTAWLVEDHSVPVIALNIGFKNAGSAYDPANKQGLARLVSNTMDEGAGSLNAKSFQKELRDLSINLGFSAGRDNFSASLKTLTKNKKRAFELLELALTQPRFDKDAVERMRQANQSRIRSSLSDPSWIAARIMNDKAYEGHPYSMNNGGTLSSLDNISIKDLKAFHEQRIGRNNIAIAVAGDITADELKTVLDEIFSDIKTVDLKPVENIDIQNGGQTFLYKHDVPQVFIEIMQPSIKIDDPAYQAAQVMNFILGSSGFGSRLTEEIREKRGLTYGVYSYFNNMNYAQSLAVSTSTSVENTGKMLSLIKAEFNKLAQTPISEQELQDAKSYLLGSLPLSLTSTDKISGLMLQMQLNGRSIDYLDTRQETIKAMRIEDIQKIAKRLLNPEKFTTVLVGQPELKDANIIKTLPNAE